MEASAAHRAQTTWGIVETTTPQTIKEAMGILMQTDLSTREETHNTTPQMHLAVGTTALSQWT